MASFVKLSDSAWGLIRCFLNCMPSDRVTRAENDIIMTRNYKFTGSMIIHYPYSSTTVSMIGVNDQVYSDFKMDA